jgi:predicted phosphoadenosine phosphosulfate sulfurtransferase
MEIFLKNNVFDEALRRIRYLFDEFENIVVSFSGGKDSTVVLNLALMVAEEKNRLPLKVLFIDQEAEWEMNISYIRETFKDSRIEPLWMQMPFKIFNATSTTEQWLQCWKEGDEWIREKEDISIKENIYGTDRFVELFGAIFNVMYKDKKACYLGGVRTEESPSRKLGLTVSAPYKWITWGKLSANSKKKEHYTFYPIYDWSYTDVWKAIHDNKWQYCKLYDYMYQYGIPIQEMRVSNVHHETEVKSLFFMQEIERENWNNITKRISGINTAKQLKGNAFRVEKLPYMFEDWEEYRDFLLEKLITDAEHKKKFISLFNSTRAKTCKTCKPLYEKFCRTCITAILKNDYHMTVINNFFTNQEHAYYIKWKQGRIPTNQAHGKYIEYELNRSN